MKSRFHPIKRKDGLYEARYWARFPDGTKKQRSLYDRDVKRLRQRYIEAAATAALGKSEKTGGMTTEAFLLNWIKGVKDIKDSTRRGYEIIIHKHILPHIGLKPISEINLSVMQNLVDTVIGEGNSVRTAQFIKWIMSKALRRARKLGLTTVYIDTRDIELPQYKAKEVAVWTSEELKKFLEACKGDKYEWFYLLYSSYGLRRGEAIPIKWEDIDWEEGTISINKQYTRVGATNEIETPKTDSSIRKLPILPHIQRYLDTINPYKDKTGLILKEDGEIIVPDKVSRRFRTISRSAGLPIVVIHSVRHSVATLLKDAGVPVRDIQAILGHSTPLTTLKYYQHTDINEKREGLTKYSDLMGF